MKKLLLSVVLITTSGCSVLENAGISRSMNFDKPTDIVIDCNPTPELIYSKTGDLIETVYPILHPYCEGFLGEQIVLPATALAAITGPRDDNRDDDDNRGFDVSSASDNTKADDRNTSQADDDDRSSDDEDDASDDTEDQGSDEQDTGSNDDDGSSNDDTGSEDTGSGDDTASDDGDSDDGDSDDDGGSAKDGGSCSAKGC